MTFLLRMAFWLGVVILLLPDPGLRSAAPESQTGAMRILGTQPTSADARPLCPRQLEECSDAVRAFLKLGRNVYQFLTERVQRSGKTAGAPREPSQNTLTSQDRVLPWRGSAPRSEAARTRPI